MTTSPSVAIKLYGTEAPVIPLRTLKAGPLSVEFDQGSLRFIRLNGVEAIRNIAFVPRDKDWGTYNPIIENLSVEQRADGFAVSFDAICKDAKQELHYQARITGSADGTLTFEGSGRAITDFLTNRTGFVVLHPVAGVAGHPVEVEHVDGSVDETIFPALIDPIQPFKDIRALTHEVLPGAKVTCRMEGDTFEMEDQRQWGDASYKTYVRPIGLPWPFTMKAGETTEQSVTVSISGSLPASAGAGKTAPVSVALGDTIGIVPRIGLGLEPQHTAAALAHIDLVKGIGPRLIVCWFDLSAGHGLTELKQFRQLGSAVGTELVLEAIIPCQDFTAEIDSVAKLASGAGVSFSAVSFSPVDYLKSIMPGSQWPDVPPLEDIYDAARAAFPGVTLGGGMSSYFPELNRKRPPVRHLDYITHTSNVITHAGDDITVTENLETLPYIIETCRSFAGGKPYRVGPSSIGMRFNPYGDNTMDNSGNERIAMARMDPRQRGLINAAWNVGYLAHMARGGVETIALSAPVGEFGLIYHEMDWQQPWYDETKPAVYPAYHVVAGVAAASGGKLLQTSSSNSHDVECLAYRNNGQTVVWIANLTAEDRSVVVEGLAPGKVSLKHLDADSFEQCVSGPDGFESTAETELPESLQLSPYAVIRVICVTA